MEFEYRSRSLGNCTYNLVIKCNDLTILHHHNIKITPHYLTMSNVGCMKKTQWRLLTTVTERTTRNL